MYTNVQNHVKRVLLNESFFNDYYLFWIALDVNQRSDSQKKISFPVKFFFLGIFKYTVCVLSFAFAVCHEVQISI